MIDFAELSQKVIDGDVEATGEMTRAALKAKVSAEDILNKGLIPGIRKVGEFFGAGKYFLPELLMAGKAMNTAMAILEPELIKAKVGPRGRYVIGTVRGDMHDIGKNIVVMLLRSNGWEVTDLGVDVPPEDFCAAVAKGNCQILGMSALLTTTMAVVKETIGALRASGLRDQVKVMVGGAPMTQEWANRAGADGYASDGAEAVIVAEALIRKK
ncbi:MAG: corrinoid protein [Deltaproteobacteria bacterium]|nr:corrinoid protein [Deltaproteobacteria bacterium]